MARIHMKNRPPLLLAALAFMALPVVASAAGAPARLPDLHAYWDDRCASCHGDAGPFARQTLRVDQGRLVGRHHVDDLDEFLRHHMPAAGLQAPVVAMLTAQVSTPPTFKAECGACHGAASGFARQSLLRRDGVLVGRSSGRPVTDMLRSHGGLAPEEIAPMAQTLERVHREVGAPGQAGTATTP